MQWEKTGRRRFSSSVGRILCSAGLPAVFLRQLCQLIDAVRPPLQHRQMIAGKFRAYAAEQCAMLLAAGVGGAHAGARPFLAVAAGFEAATAQAVRFLPAALAAFATGGDAGEVNLPVRGRASRIRQSASA